LGLTTPIDTGVLVFWTPLRTPEAVRVTVPVVLGIVHVTAPKVAYVSLIECSMYKVVALRGQLDPHEAARVICMLVAAVLVAKFPYLSEIMTSR